MSDGPETLAARRRRCDDAHPTRVTRVDPRTPSGWSRPDDRGVHRRRARSAGRRSSASVRGLVPGLAGAGAGRGLHVGTLPSRWFPADRDKLIYLAIAAHLAPAVLTQLVSAPTGAWFEDRNALVTTLEQQESDRP